MKFRWKLLILLLGISNESVVGVASLLVTLSSLLELALPLSEIPAGTMTYLCTLAFRPSTRIVGAEILASAQDAKMTNSKQKLVCKPVYFCRCISAAMHGSPKTIPGRLTQVEVLFSV
jgi:hypothetical protein